MSQQRQRLVDGAAAMGIALTALQSDRLLAYLALLVKWNRAYNLTAVRDPDEMLPRHLLDSLSILPLVIGAIGDTAARILDVGTGAGLPGIPLAIMLPGARFTLLDSNGKKTRFVRQAQLELGLENVEVVHARVEELHPAEPFDLITSRAFAPLPRMFAQTAHLLAPGGGYLAMKGAVPVEEIAELDREGILAEVVPLQVPGTEGERHAILLRRGCGAAGG